MCIGLKEGSDVKDLVELMKTYQAMLLPHFKHEEDFASPLMRAYFTHEGEYNISCPAILRSVRSIESHLLLLHKRVCSCHGGAYEAFGSSE
jgi:hypothetical protein